MKLTACVTVLVALLLANTGTVEGTTEVECLTQLRMAGLDPVRLQSVDSSRKYKMCYCLEDLACWRACKYMCTISDGATTIKHDYDTMRVYGFFATAQNNKVSTDKFAQETVAAANQANCKKCPHSKQVALAAKNSATAALKAANDAKKRIRALFNNNGPAEQRRQAVTKAQQAADDAYKAYLRAKEARDAITLDEGDVYTAVSEAKRHRDKADRYARRTARYSCVQCTKDARSFAQTAEEAYETAKAGKENYLNVRTQDAADVVIQAAKDAEEARAGATAAYEKARG